MMTILYPLHPSREKIKNENEILYGTICNLEQLKFRFASSLNDPSLDNLLHVIQTSTNIQFSMTTSV